jgi:hypothetical protein
MRRWRQEAGGGEQRRRIPEIIEHDVSGNLVEPENPERLTAEAAARAG